MSTWALILAAGSGTRMGGSVPKVLLPLAGRPAIAWSVSVFETCPLVDGLCLVTTPELRENLTELLAACKKPWKIALGGKTRGESVNCGLAALPADAEWVAVHDGARPCLKKDDLERLLLAMKESGSAVAGHPLHDTLHRVDEQGFAVDTPPRKGLWQVQTPQCFPRKALQQAYALVGTDLTDDAAVFAAAGHAVKLIACSNQNMKLTVPEDVPLIEAAITGQRLVTGTGYDAHRLVEGRKLILCGVEVPFEKGLDGHSDADVATHALMDALLGAACLGDIGKLFPPSDMAYKDIDSMILLERVMAVLKEHHMRPLHGDVTIVAQQPKLMPYREEMRRRLADAMGLPTAMVSVKATTTEGMGFEGRGEGMSAQAAVTLFTQA